MYDKEKPEEKNTGGSRLFFKDVVYIMSIILLAAMMLLMVIYLPETIRKNSDKSEIDQLKKMIEDNNDYINNLQDIINSIMKSQNSGFPGIQVEYPDGATQPYALTDADSGIDNIIFYYRNGEDGIIQAELKNLPATITIGDGIYLIYFSYRLIADTYKSLEDGIDLYKGSTFAVLCKIIFEDGSSHILYITGKNNSNEFKTETSPAPETPELPAET